LKVHELQEQRSQAVAEMRRMADAVEKRGDDYSADEEKRHNELKASISALDTRIQRARDIAEAERSAPAIIAGNGRDGSFEERARGFSVVKAIMAQCGDAPFDGLERELSRELSTRTGRSFNGIGVPDQALETRTLLTTGAASDLYPTQHRPDLFIDMRRSALVTGTLGATVLSGLVGDQAIPRQIQSSTAQHVAEDAPLTETDADFDDVELSPTTVGALTSFSRRALINAQPSVEQLVRRDLAAVVARTVDFQAVFGDGNGNRPTGVVNEAGVHSLTLAGPTWAQALAFISAIEAEDADIGSMGWLTHPAALATLRSTNRVSGEPEHGFLMAEPGNLAGYRLVTTTAVPTTGEPASATTVIFGAWSQLLIGLWSGIDLLANPYSDSAFPRGRVQVRAMQDYDAAVRHGEAFAVASNLAV
jgi:HK97 family phage major capsid protein